MKFSTRTIVFMGLLAAINILLNHPLAIMPTPTLRIAFGEVPLIIAGILFGPMAGVLTGIVSDLLGMMIPQGVFFIGFTISAALTGFIPGLFFWGNRQTQKFSLAKSIVSVVIVNVFISLILNNVWLSIMYSKGFWALLPGRLLARAIILPLEVVFVIVILRALEKYRTSH